MKLVDVLFFLLALTFFPFHAGILSRTSQWKRLADAIELDPRGILTWRKHVAVTRELPIATRYFAIAAAISLLLVVFSLKLPVLFIWTSLAFFVSFLAWFGFRWSFDERRALRQLAPVVGYSLIAPWLFLVVDYAGPKVGLFTAYAEKLWFLKYVSYTPHQLAGYLFLGIVALLVFYFVFAWLVFKPFAWLVMVALKASHTATEHVVRRTGHDLVFVASAAVQVFGLFWFYWISRHM